jgi:biopolymer transport protein TolR
VKKATATPHMNITPLVDVVLVLLIIFMVVTPLLSKTFALNLPKKDDVPAPPDAPQEQVVVRVTRDGKLFINQTEVPKKELSTRIGRYMAAKADKVVYFDADNEAPYANAVEAMDLARGGGAKTVAIMTEALLAP